MNYHHARLLASSFGSGLHSVSCTLQLLLPLHFLSLTHLICVNLLGCSPAQKLLDILPAPVSVDFHWILPAALIGFILDSDCWSLIKEDHQVHDDTGTQALISYT